MMKSFRNLSSFRVTSILTFLAEEMQKSGFLVIYYNIFGEFVLLKIGSSEHLKQSRHIVHDLSFCHIRCFFATGGRSFEAENVLSENERALSEVLQLVHPTKLEITQK